MRSTLAFVAGILVGFLLAWAGGPAVTQRVGEWSALPGTEIFRRMSAGLDSPQGGLTVGGKPTAQLSPVVLLRRPVTRTLRMTASGPVIALQDPGLPVSAAGLDGSAVPDSVPDSVPPVPQPGPAGADAQVTALGAPDPEPAAKASADRKAKAVAPAGTAAQVYARALENYRQGRFAPAREEFALFLESFPGHHLAPNALYWSGETWYAQARYDRAAEYFSRVVRDHPRHAKSPDALLKLAYSATRQGRLEQAAGYLRQLESRYPDSPASRLGRQAKSRLHGQNGSAGTVLARG